MGLAPDIFPARLRMARAAARLTGSELSKRTKVQRTTITNFESGLRRPSLDTLFDLAVALGVSSDYLLGLDDVHLDGRPEPPLAWVTDLLPDLAALDRSGQAAVRALVKGLKK